MKEINSYAYQIQTILTKNNLKSTKMTKFIFLIILATLNCIQSIDIIFLSIWMNIEYTILNIKKNTHNTNICYQLY